MPKLKQKPNKKKMVIGITGSFGSGKTTVARIFKSYGATVIDADKIAHQIIKPQSPLYRKIVKALGKGILKKDRTVNRKKIARIVFKNRPLLKKLQRLMHPQIICEIKKQIQKARTKIVVLDAPLLIEAGLRKMLDKLMVVTIKRKEQIKRIQQRTGLSNAEILSRIKSQIPLSVKVRMADFVIDNSGTRAKVRKAIAKLRRQGWKR